MKRISYTHLMELVSALDEFVCTRFPEGLPASVPNVDIVRRGLCDSIPSARAFRRIYRKNPVLAFFFLISERYREMRIDSNRESTDVLGSSSLKRAEFIYHDIHIPHIYGRTGMKRNRKSHAECREHKPELR